MSSHSAPGSIGTSSSATSSSGTSSSGSADYEPIDGHHAMFAQILHAKLATVTDRGRPPERTARHAVFRNAPYDRAQIVKAAIARSNDLRHAKDTLAALACIDTAQRDDGLSDAQWGELQHQRGHILQHGGYYDEALAALQEALPKRDDAGRAPTLYQIALCSRARFRANNAADTLPANIRQQFATAAVAMRTDIANQPAGQQQTELMRNLALCMDMTGPGETA